jgi:hypothetical protein
MSSPWRHRAERIKDQLACPDLTARTAWRLPLPLPLQAHDLLPQRQPVHVYRDARSICCELDHQRGALTRDGGGLVDRHLRRLEPTAAQCRTITVDTQGCIRFADDGEACADTSLIASPRSSARGSLRHRAAAGGGESASAEAKLVSLSAVCRSSEENSLAGRCAPVRADVATLAAARHQQDFTA